MTDPQSFVTLDGGDAGGAANRPAPPPPSREVGLDRLRGFVDEAGRAYASKRNYDLPERGHPHVSQLSPYLRHRLVTEAEVLDAVLARWSLSSAEKFVQEVFWRTYFKGWLEMRPGVWRQYREEVRQGLDRIATESGLRRDWEAACRGQTGIDAFDHWAQELVTSGYLHNHARMWFASIWCFTLKLPWALGADFFLRHLYDGDPASNTLGWRWVAGLQTRGKTYLARPDNIARYTEGRFRPEGLAQSAQPLDGPSPPKRRPVPEGGTWAADRPTGWLVCEDDLCPAFVLAQSGATAPLPTALLNAAPRRSPLQTAPQVVRFTDAALDDAVRRHEDRIADIHRAASDAPAADLARWAEARGLSQLVTSYAPTGPAAEVLDDLDTLLGERDISLIRVQRPYDARAWPHATAGFFKFRDHIPDLLAQMGG